MMTSKNKLKKKMKRQKQFFTLEEKRFLNFVRFWQFITDRNPKFCVLCGKYIAISFVIFADLVKKLKGENVIHVECAKKFVTYKMINERLSEESLLICDYQPIEKIPFDSHCPMLKVAPFVCRTKVKNTQPDLLAHLVKGHEYDMDNFENFKKLRYDYFLKPTGIPFSKVRT